MVKIELVDDESNHDPLIEKFEKLIKTIKDSNFSEEADSSDQEVAEAVISSLRRYIFFCKYNFVWK